MYLVSENNDIYKCLFTDNEKILLVNVGDTVTGVVEDGFLKLKKFFRETVTLSVGECALSWYA